MFLKKASNLQKKTAICILKPTEKLFFDGGIILDNEKIENYKDNIKMIDLSYLGITLHELGNRGFRRAYHCCPKRIFRKFTSTANCKISKKRTYRI